MTQFYPMKMKPVYKEYLWGGTKLKTQYHKDDAPDVTAESWELADLPDGQSVAENGMTIEEMGRIDQEGYWGKDASLKAFPVLVKLIDAAKDLSIQVHPSDANARADLGEKGKAEMWYVVDCDPQATLYYGFSEAIGKEEFLRRAQDGTICEVLNQVKVNKGDVFYILPGTIHAIGAGILIAEIQQSSNTTFRVYDYKRKGPDGKERPLHLERAAEVINFTPMSPQDCKICNSLHTDEFVYSEMFRCRYFSAYCIDVLKKIDLNCDGTTAHHILCVDGEGELVSQGKHYPIRRGESYFMPAALGDYSIQGECRVLLSKR